MPSEISVPFRLGPDHKIASESIPDAQIRQHVMSLINTEPGERVILGNYGIPLSDLVFEGSDEVVASDLASDISDALAVYEPGVAVQQIATVPGVAGDGLAMVNVRYLRTDAPEANAGISRSQNVAVVTAGGKVSEVIRG